MNLFFIFIFKTLTYSRADIKGVRAIGDKRRIAWPEMLIILFPLYWAVNIVSNALMYTRVVDSVGGHPLVQVQLTGYQWGWKYCYGDTFYPKYFHNMISVGYDNVISFAGGGSYVFKDAKWDSLKGWVTEKKPFLDRDGKHVKTSDGYVYSHKIDIQKTVKMREDWWRTKGIKDDLDSEVYFCRWWMKNNGVLEQWHKNSIKNTLFQTGYWVTAQGLDPNVATWENMGKIKKLVEDPLRLLRSTGSLVLPTQNAVRLMSCSEDVTHSWAVPGLGLKMDCVPGRLFCALTIIYREGVYYGQCSELCGWNHYNMPIVLYALPLEHFIIWWELELHAIFLQPTVVDSVKKIYPLINSKYK